MSSRAAVFGVLVGLTCAGDAAGQTGPTIEVDAEIVLAVDASRSMDKDEFAVQRAGYAAAFRHADLIRGDTRRPPPAGSRSAYFEWAGEARDGTHDPVAGHRKRRGRRRHRRGDRRRAGHLRGTSISRALAFATRWSRTTASRAPAA